MDNEPLDELTPQTERNPVHSIRITGYDPHEMQRVIDTITPLGYVFGRIRESRGGFVAHGRMAKDDER